MTAQIAETVIEQGHAWALQAWPLHSCFVFGGDRPEFRFRTTACWRGYRLEWTNQDDRLHLTGLAGRQADRSEIGLPEVFPGFGDRVFAPWFTGTLELPQGNLLERRNQGLFGKYE